MTPAEAAVEAVVLLLCKRTRGWMRRSKTHKSPVTAPSSARNEVLCVVRLSAVFALFCIFGGAVWIGSISVAFEEKRWPNFAHARTNARTNTNNVTTNRSLCCSFFRFFGVHACAREKCSQTNILQVVLPKNIKLAVSRSLFIFH